MPKVSIIIPTYDHNMYLGEAIQSALDQTYQDFEIIIVDDGSSEPAHTLVEAFRDDRIQYVYQQNRGLAAARNTGLKAAQGELIAFLDADDIFLPNKLAMQVSFLDTIPEIGVVGGGYIVTNEALEPLRESRPWEYVPGLSLETWLFHCPFVSHAPLTCRSWLEKVQGFDEALRRVEDWDLWLRLARAGCKMAWLEELVCCYRFHPGSMVRDAASQAQVSMWVLDKFFADHDLPPQVERLKAGAYANACLNGAARAYLAEDVSTGMQFIRQAFEYDPTLYPTPDKVIDALNGWAENPLGQDTFRYIFMVFNNLPEEIQVLKDKRRRAIGRGMMGIFFSAQRRRDWRTARRAWRLGVWYDPTWLCNRGVISLGLEAFLGPSVARRFRSAFRRISGKQGETPI